MNLKDFICTKDKSLQEFSAFSSELKSSFRTLDGYAFDFNDSITSIKLYYKIYNRKEILKSDFFKWFLNEQTHIRARELLSTKQELNKNSISGLNFGIKYNLATEEITKSFYFGDKKNVSLGLSATNGVSPVAAYEVKLYLTPDTPDAAAFSYKSQGVAGAVAVFENVCDSNGTAFNFYKMVVSYSGLTNSSGPSANFTAVVASL